MPQRLQLKIDEKIRDENDNCTCYRQVNEQLYDYGTQIVTKTIMNIRNGNEWESPPLLMTERTVKSATGIAKQALFCRYCPFCGNEYKRPKENTDGQEESSQEETG